MGLLATSVVTETQTDRHETSTVPSCAFYILEQLLTLSAWLKDVNLPSVLLWCYPTHAPVAGRGSGRGSPGAAGSEANQAGQEAVRLPWSAPRRSL